MRITIITIGSTGDVLPYTGLARRLAADGHEVAIATHAPFEDTVRTRGVGFHPLPMDMEAELTSTRGRRALRTSSQGSAAMARLYLQHWRALGTAIVEAATGSDLLLVSAMGWQGVHVAEALGIPSMGVYLQPMEPTTAFPPWMVTQRSLGAHGNRVAAKGVRTLGQVPFRSATRALRRDLGLEPVGIRQHFARLERERWPALHGFSPTVLPAPPDWPEWRGVVGYWWPAAATGWEPSTELVDFLEDGDPPVLVTLGSMAPQDAERRFASIRTALRAAGRRAIVQTGWAGAGTAPGHDLLTIGSAPHDWLMARVTAVVHHAGAGTTAAGLRAGLPAVPLPLAADQPLWARRLVELGAAPDALPLRRLDEGRLAEAIRRAVEEPGPRARSREVADRMAGEDGAGAVAEAIRTGRYW